MFKQVADVQTAVVQHANDEESDDEHVCHGAAQAIAAQVVGRAFDVDNRKRDCKRNRSIEQNVDYGPHVGALSSQPLGHLQEIVD